MTKQKSTKRALLSSVLALVLCVSMLVGSTFAWFTDSVESTGNIIKSGTLDIEMTWADGKADPATAEWTDASKGAIFKSELWEPGYTEVRHIKIKNAGTLALKYQLNVTANGEVSELADVIDVYYLDPAKQIADRAALAGEKPMSNLTNALAGLATTGNGNLKAGEEVIVTIALKMRESAGNEYQNLSIGADFAIRLLATQYTYEKDSFDDQYDKDAAWDGTYPTEKPDSLVVDTEKKLISINDVQAFAYLNTLVNDADFYNLYGSKWRYTIELNTDVNLLGKAWTPILLSNFVAFEGNGHTISNLYVSATGNKAGLFADISCNDIGVTYVRDLTIDGAYVKGNYHVGALAGASTQGAIENVTINNATVIGVKYVGGVFGWGNGSVNGSTVKNSTIVIPEIGEKEAGGLIGYLSNDGKESTENKVIANNRVENVTVTAPTIASGLVSQPNSSNKGGALIEIKNNTMKNVTITTTADATAALYVSNNVAGKTVVENNTAQDCIVAVSDTLSYLESKKEYRFATATVDRSENAHYKVLEGDYTDHAFFSQEFAAGNVFDGGEAKFANVSVLANYCTEADDVFTVKNVTSEGTLIVGSAGGTIVIDNCAVKAMRISGASKIIVKNSTINGYGENRNGDNGGYGMYIIPSGDYALSVIDNTINNCDMHCIAVQAGGAGDIEVSGNNFKAWGSATTKTERAAFKIWGDTVLAPTNMSSYADLGAEAKALVADILANNTFPSDLTAIGGTGTQVIFDFFGAAFSAAN